MTKLVRLFLRKEEGAVTVDWVVLSAVIIGMVMIVLVPVALSTTSATVGVANYIANVPGYGEE